MSDVILETSQEIQGIIENSTLNINVEIVTGKGEQGAKGDTGAVPNIAIGTTSTLIAGSSATVTRRAESPDTAPILDFGIPKGYDGTGTGDMSKSQYDTDDDGIVNDSSKLGGQFPAYYAKQSEVETHLAETASTTAKGHIQLANNAEVTTGTDTSKAVTPAGAKVELDKKVNSTALGTAAYTASTAYATATQGTTADNALPKAGGTMSGEINCADQLLTKPKLKDYSEALGTTPATTGTVTFDLTTGNTFDVTPTDAIIFVISNPPASGSVGSFTLQINMPATLYAMIYPASFKWDKGTIPTHVAGKTAIITGFTLDAGVTYRVGAFGTEF